MPITRTASISPSNACSPNPIFYSWIRVQGGVGTLPNTALLSAISPGRYVVTATCLSSPALCSQTASTYIQCFQAIDLTSPFTALTNITVQSPEGVNVQLNTVSGFSFPYANSDTGVVNLRNDLNTWLLANNGTSSEVIFTKSGLGTMAVLSSWTFVSVTTTAGTFPFNVNNCNAQTFSVSAANTSTGPPPVLGQATATATNCLSGQERYGWYNGTTLVNTANPASLTRGTTYTLRAICLNTAQWATATVLVT